MAVAVVWRKQHRSWRQAVRGNASSASSPWCWAGLLVEGAETQLGRAQAEEKEALRGPGRTKTPLPAGWPGQGHECCRALASVSTSVCRSASFPGPALPNVPTATACGDSPGSRPSSFPEKRTLSPHHILLRPPALSSPRFRKSEDTPSPSRLCPGTRQSQSHRRAEAGGLTLLAQFRSGGHIRRARAAMGRRAPACTAKSLTSPFSQTPKWLKA